LSLGESFASLHRIVDRERDRQRPARLEQNVEILSLQIFHDEVRERRSASVPTSDTRATNSL